MSKPRVAFFDFASCEGCQLQVANLEEAVIDVVKLIDVVEMLNGDIPHALLGIDLQQLFHQNGRLIFMPAKLEG